MQALAPNSARISVVRLWRERCAHRLSLAVLILSLCLFASPFASAQRAGASGHSGPANFHTLGGSRAPGRARSGLSGPRRAYPYGLGYPGYGSLPFPFFGDNFDPGDIYSTGYPVASEPPPYLMQALQGLIIPAANPLGSVMTANGREHASAPGPLMIELQNGRYVHVNSPEINGDAQPLNFSENSAPAKSRTIKTPQADSQETIAAAPLTPVTLVFRDGHSEEVRDYTIAQGTLYARGDYYTDGYWNKKIDLAALNVPDTLQANAAHNVKFVLPSSPNEVITRP
jgi:hypothetical protein